MTTGYESLADLVKQISACETGQQVFDIFWSAAQPHGFTSALIVRANGIASAQSNENSFFAFNNLPQWWEQRYLEKSYGHIDPFAQMVMKRTGPFRWAECYENLTPAQEEMIADSKAHGLKYGINFPMHYAQGAIGLVLLGAEDDFTLSPDTLIFLEILARHSFERINTLFGDAHKAELLTLSEREREILTLVAQGKTNWEIGAILDISEFSVRDYLKDVSKRMQTSNRTHTVTRAIQLGLILP